MGVREFDAVCQATSRQGADDPESWDGEERNPFWQEAEEKRREARGW